MTQSIMNFKLHGLCIHNRRESGRRNNKGHFPLNPVASHFPINQLLPTFKVGEDHCSHKREYIQVLWWCIYHRVIYHARWGHTGSKRTNLWNIQDSLEEYKKREQELKSQHSPRGHLIVHIWKWEISAETYHNYHFTAYGSILPPLSTAYAVLCTSPQRYICNECPRDAKFTKSWITYVKKDKLRQQKYFFTTVLPFFFPL